MCLMAVPPQQYWMKNAVYLSKDGLPLVVYLSKAHFQEIHQLFQVSPCKSPTETLEYFSVWVFNSGYSAEAAAVFLAVVPSTSQQWYYWVMGVLRSQDSIQHLFRVSTAVNLIPHLIPRLNLVSSTTSKSSPIILVRPRSLFWKLFVG